MSIGKKQLQGAHDEMEVEKLTRWQLPKTVLVGSRCSNVNKKRKHTIRTYRRNDKKTMKVQPKKMFILLSGTFLMRYKCKHEEGIIQS